MSTQSTSIPEELYNLTQLADVTLAAGKLSTTNIHMIKNYMQQTENVNIKNDNNFGSNEKILSLNDSGYMSDFENVSKQQRSIFNHQQQSNESVSLYLTPKKTFSDQRQSSFSSSEDDSVFNYSHKIFDKRKSRKLCYQSDDSEACVSFTTLASQKSITETEDSLPSMSETDSQNDILPTKKILENGNNGDDIHICPECGKKYSTSSNLARHRQTHRSLMDKKARRCPHCDKVYVSMPAYSMHVRTHNQGCECPHCGKRFSRPWLLQGHIRTHTGNEITESIQKFSF